MRSLAQGIPSYIQLITIIKSWILYQGSDFDDLVIEQEEFKEVDEPRQRAQIADLVYAQIENLKAGKSRQRAQIADLIFFHSKIYETAEFRQRSQITDLVEVQVEHR